VPRRCAPRPRLALHPGDAVGAGDILDLLGNSLAASVSNTPVGSTSSGVTYQFVGGLPVKTATSGGPIFGERAQTLGKGRFFVGTNISAMHFERLRGVRMDDVEFNFTHQDTPPLDTLGVPFSRRCHRRARGDEHQSDS